MRRRAPWTIALLSAATLLSGVTGLSAATAGPPAAAPRAAAAKVPALQVTRIATGLDIPWDVRSLGNGRILITERSTKRLLLWDHGEVTVVRFPSQTVWAAGETGLMGLLLDPGFAKNGRFYTCQGGFRSGSGHDVRVNAWTMNAARTSARLSRTLLKGIPATSGRHGGCRLLIQGNGALVVGTGDAATGKNPRSLYSLGGKTLRLNRMTGAPWSGNRWIKSSSRTARYVLSYGHRNVQGLAQRSDGTIWSVEQGTSRDDEVNRIWNGRDYGYNPVPGYDESVPMTDHGLPGAQMSARWRSGSSTLATSGAAWIRGKQWGVYNGALAVATLKAERMLLMTFDSKDKLTSVRTPAALRKFGRLRSVTRAGSGDLLVTTSNGGGKDSLLRVHPIG